MSNEIRDNKIASLYTSLAAEFLEKESEGKELITVTGIKMSKDRKNVSILISVFPDLEENRVLRFTKRKRSDFRQYIKTKIPNLGLVPTFDFEIDQGEKNRQRIDQLSRQDNNR